MNIQIFGRSKCFDTKKAERYFKERRIKFQSVDINKYGLSPGELRSVRQACGLDNIIDWDSKSEEIDLLRYLSSDGEREEKLLDEPRLIKTPIVRNGKKATVGYCPEIWATWE